MMEAEETAVEAIEHHEMLQFAGPARGTSLAKRRFTSSFLSSLSVTSCTISYTRSAKQILILLILVTSVLLVAGGAFTSIGIEDGNYNTAVAAFFTACLSMGSISILALHLVGKLERFHDLSTLEGLKVLGMACSVAAGIALGVHTILAFFARQGFDLHGTNYFSSAVFSGLLLVSSVQLYLVSQYYQNALQALAELRGPTKGNQSLQLTFTSFPRPSTSP